MIVLGIDPGTKVTGFGLIKKHANYLEPLDFGCIVPPIKLLLHERYCIIYDAVCDLIEQYKPDALSIETQYVNKNVQSAIKLGMARGVVVVACAKKGLTVHEYAPTKAKSAIGISRANKEQMQSRIQLLLNLDAPPPHDAADALALALCHLHTTDMPCTNI